MSKGFMSQMTRPEEGERGLGASHRRGGMGVASYRRPPEGSHLRNFPEGKRGASATSKAPVAKRRVESMRDKGAKRAASGKLHIDDGCMGGGEAIDHIEYLTEDDEDNIETNHFDLLPNGQPSNRNGIFFYCLFADKNDNDDPRDKSDWGTIVWGESGKPFAIYAGIIPTIKGEAATFMHELGHNLELEHPPHTYTGYGSVPRFAKTCMRTGYSGWIDYMDYHEVEWKVVQDNIDPW